MKKAFCYIFIIAAVVSIYFIRQRFGNVFFMSYALNSAKKICAADYGGRLYTGEYWYDCDKDNYYVGVSDGDNSAYITYSETEGLIDLYNRGYLSVCMNIRRGEIKKALDDTSPDASVYVGIKQTAKGIIGEDTNCVCTDVCISFGSCVSKEEFAQKIIAAFKALADSEYNVLRASAVCGEKTFCFESDRNAISVNYRDVAGRVVSSSS